MKAAVYCGVEDVCVEERPIPDIGNEDILLKVNACAICGIVEGCCKSVTGNKTIDLYTLSG